MPGLDDDQFERYLKGFRPMPPSSLPIKRSGWTSRRPVVMVTLAVAAAVLVVAAVMLRSRLEPIQSSQGESGFAAIGQLANVQPLTIHSANAMLARAPSAKAAIDSLAFRSQKTPIPQGQRSALAELGKETNKL
jgi:hypothetical protein